MNPETLQTLVTELNRQLSNGTVFAERVQNATLLAQWGVVIGALITIIPWAIWLTYGFRKRFHFDDIADYVMGGTFVALPISAVGAFIWGLAAITLANPELQVYRDVVNGVVKAVIG